jgi:hypothetical protein
VDYEALKIGACYCKTQFDNLLLKGNYMLFYDTLNNPLNMCKTFTQEYLLANGLVYLIIVFTVALNMLLKIILDKLTQFELHGSIDKLQVTLCIYVFSYINMHILKYLF